MGTFEKPPLYGIEFVPLHGRQGEFGEQIEPRDASVALA
jgi:hypothetical protein